jgi:hypothetical protein
MEEEITDKFDQEYRQAWSDEGGQVDELVRPRCKSCGKYLPHGGVAVMTVTI